MENGEYITFLIAGAVLVLLALFCRPKGRHERYQARAKALLETLRSGKMRPGQAMAYLRKVNPYVFEEAVLDGFRRKGFGITRNRSYSGDGGIDGRVSLKGKEYLVQCKRYKNHIDRRHVEDFSRICLRDGVEGYFVHTGKTGKGAREQADLWGNVFIISGQRLLELLGYKDPSEQEQ